MFRDPQFDIAELVARHFPSGVVKVRVSRPLAKRLVDNCGLINSSIQTAEDVSKLPGTSWHQLEVHYELDPMMDVQHIMAVPAVGAGLRIALPLQLQR